MKHWTEHHDAPRVRGTFRNLPPNTWDVTVHTDTHPVRGELDAADAHELIAAIIMADVGVPVPEPDIVSRETSVSG